MKCNFWSFLLKRVVIFEEETQVYPRRSADEHSAIPGLPDKPGIPGLRRAILGLRKAILGLRKAILGLRKFPVCAELHSRVVYTR